MSWRTKERNRLRIKLLWGRGLNSQKGDSDKIDKWKESRGQFLFETRGKRFFSTVDSEWTKFYQILYVYDQVLQ
jgi:hypothetical protein